MKPNYKKSLLVALLLGGAFTSYSQIINTFAGNGSHGFTGDGGPATAAELNAANGFAPAADAWGNVFITDFGNYRVRIINTAGIISTFAGNGTSGYSGDGGPATAAEFNRAYGGVVDANGNYYLSDPDNYRVRKVNAAGIITTFAGIGVTGFSGDGGPATAAELGYPYQTGADASGNIYIVDQSSNRIRKVNTAGIINTIAGITPGGFSGNGGPATAAELYGPFAVAPDNQGNIYIADYGNHRIRKINTAGIITTLAGNGTGGYSGDGGLATAAEFGQTAGLAVDASGNVYISDHTCNRVRVVNSSGIISTFAGNGYDSPTGGGFYGDGGQATAAELYWPWNISIDPAGNLYIADQVNNRIRKVGNAPLNLGVNEISSSLNQVNVYPVPNTGLFTVAGIIQGQLIELYNYMGQMLETRHALSLQTAMQFDISDKANGIYLIVIHNKDGTIVAQKKVVKIN